MEASQSSTERLNEAVMSSKWSKYTILAIVVFVMMSLLLVIYLVYQTNSASSNENNQVRTSDNTITTKTSENSSLTSSQSSISSQESENVTTAKIELVSSNTQVVNSQEWDFMLQLPREVTLNNVDDSGVNKLNKLLLSSSQISMEIKAVSLDMNMVYHDSSKLLEIQNSSLSKFMISRIKDQQSTYIYVTNFKEASACSSGEGVDPYAENFCSDGGIKDKLIKITCTTNNTESISVCDGIVKSMQVNHIIKQ